MTDHLHIVLCGDRHWRIQNMVVMESLMRYTSKPLHIHEIVDWDTEGFNISVQVRRKGVTHLRSTHWMRKRQLDLLWGNQPLRGSKATYYRLFIPEMMRQRYPEVKHALYLDGDIAIRQDVALLFRPEYLPTKRPLAVVYTGSVKTSLDRDYMIDRGWQPNTSMFNAGVMMFNLAGWKDFEVAPFLRKYTNSLMKSHDQSMLNAHFGPTLEDLPEWANRRVVYPDDKAEGPGFYHFCGGLKPWQIGGFLLPQARLWHEERVKADLNRPPLSWGRLSAYKVVLKKRLKMALENEIRREAWERK